MATMDNEGKVNTAVTLGAIGTALGGLQLLQNGGLGGLLGGNMMQAGGMVYTDQLQAQIAELKAEKYANNVGIEVYKAAAERDAKIGSRFEEIAREIADMRVREAQTQGQIAMVASNATNGINSLQGQIACLRNTVAGITRTVVPRTAVCPEPMPMYNSWTAPTTADAPAAA